MAQIFVVGYPVSGKSFLARKLAETIHKGYMSTGDVVRSVVLTDEDIQEFKEKDFSTRLNNKVMEEVEAGIRLGKVIDGFPRSTAQIDYIEERFKKKGRVIMVWVSANPVNIYERLKVRALQECRKEDTPDVVAGRLDVMKLFKAEIVDFCFVCQYPFISINTDYETVEVAIEKICREM
jgi:adenylate kinase